MNNLDKCGHYNRDIKCSYRDISILYYYTPTTTHTRKWVVNYRHLWMKIIFTLLISVIQIFLFVFLQVWERLCRTKFPIVPQTACASSGGAVLGCYGVWKRPGGSHPAALFTNTRKRWRQPARAHVPHVDARICFYASTFIIKLRLLDVSALLCLLFKERVFFKN